MVNHNSDADCLFQLQLGHEFSPLTGEVCVRLLPKGAVRPRVHLRTQGQRQGAHQLSRGKVVLAHFSFIDLPVEIQNRIE